MYINSVGYYIPKTRIDNNYFTELNGLTSDWIQQRTGILSRSRASEIETMDYMCIEAVKNAMVQLPYRLKEIDLIVFASYTPSDIIANSAYVVQKELHIDKSKVLMVSSACSSGVNGIEIIDAFIATKKASKALLICADRNSTYSNEEDPQSGHLWGDAAVAYFFSDNKYGHKDVKLVDLISYGLGHIGHGPQGVYLNPLDGGLQMPYGKDVFINACTYMTSITREIVERNDCLISDIDYFIGHQANQRILKNVAKQLEIPEEKVLSNIEELGNTGSVGSLLVFAQNYDRYEIEDLICLSVFGGGYSVGSCLFEIV